MKREHVEAIMQEYDFFDGGLMLHAYRRYMRDYEFIVYLTGAHDQGILSYVFRYCPEVHCQSSLLSWQENLDDRLTDYDSYSELYFKGVDLGGFVWGVGGEIHGWRLPETSERALEWSEKLGIEFHEMVVETNTLKIRLVFSDLFVRILTGEVPSHDDYHGNTFPDWLKRHWTAPAPTLPFAPD